MSVAPIAVSSSQYLEQEDPMPTVAPSNSPVLAHTSNNPPDSRAELIAALERVARIWKERSDTEAAAWARFTESLSKTRHLEEALEAYSDFSWQRMRNASEDVRRLFEEYLSLSAKFPSRQPRWLLNGSFL